MHITVNGESHAIESGLTVSALLGSLGFADKPVVVELNGNALTPSEHPTIAITDGAKLEVITLAAGG